MNYLGSKWKIATSFLPLILRGRDDVTQTYFEPFCGGCNSLDKVSGKRIGVDNNYYLIQLLKHMQKPGFELPWVGEDAYYRMKQGYAAFEPWLVGYAGFCLSFGGSWFNGYKRATNTSRDYEQEAQDNLRAQAPKLESVEFVWADYDGASIPDNSIIYCDPPYKGTKEYKKPFCHQTFWRWAEVQVSLGHKVFVSEYDAPSNWKCIWELQHATSLAVSRSIRTVERVFTLERGS